MIYFFCHQVYNEKLCEMQYSGNKVSHPIIFNRYKHFINIHKLNWVIIFSHNDILEIGKTCVCVC